MCLRRAGEAYSFSYHSRMSVQVKSNCCEYGSYIGTLLPLPKKTVTQENKTLIPSKKNKQDVGDSYHLDARHRKILLNKNFLPIMFIAFIWTQIYSLKLNTKCGLLVTDGKQVRNFIWLLIVIKAGLPHMVTQVVPCTITHNNEQRGHKPSSHSMQPGKVLLSVLE